MKPPALPGVISLILSSVDISRSPHSHTDLGQFQFTQLTDYIGLEPDRQQMQKGISV
jgi:hypothetical protein